MVGCGGSGALLQSHSGSVQVSAVSNRKEKTTPFGSNLTRTLVACWTARSVVGTASWLFTVDSCDLNLGCTNGPTAVQVGQCDRPGKNQSEMSTQTRFPEGISCIAVQQPKDGANQS